MPSAMVALLCMGINMLGRQACADAPHPTDVSIVLFTDFRVQLSGPYSAPRQTG